MKTLSQYVNDNYLFEGLSEYDKQLLNEGLGNFFGKIFGWASGKTQNMVKDFKNSYETTLANVLAGKKSKDKKVQQDSEELQDKLKDCENEKDLLETYKVYGETLLTKTLKEVDDPLWAISVKRQLANLGKTLKDDEALELAKKLDDAIKDRWKENDVKKANNTLDATENNIKEQTKKEETTNSEGNGNNKEIKQEVSDAITEEKDILGPLAEEAGLEGKYLLEYIANKIDAANKKSDKPIDPKSDKFDKLVLGMCITVCGAIITDDPDLFSKISDMLNLENKTVKDLKTRIKDSIRKKKDKEKESK